MNASIQITNITDSVKAKGDNSTLLQFSSDGIFPVYAKEMLATYLLMEWPLYPSNEFIRCFAILLPHGKTHVAEVFFMKQNQEASLMGEYLGTSQMYTVILPENIYSSSMDEQISEKIWQQFNAEGSLHEN